MSSSKKLSILIIFLFLCKLAPSSSSSSDTNFTFNDFKSSKLILDGVTQITSNGLLQLTNRIVPAEGHAFYPNSIQFKTPSSSGSAFSFSTSFIFAVQSELSNSSCMGIVFFIAPKPAFPGSRPAQYMGLFNETNIGNSSNHIFGVELDTILTEEFHDINDNHVGININSLISNVSAPASYFLNPTSYKNISLSSGKPMQVWIDYNGTEMQTTVSIAPTGIEKPVIPLLTLRLDLSPVFNDNMYVGFSAATASFYTYHYILAWSFAVNGSAPEIDISKLPKLPRTTPKKVSKMTTIGVPIIGVVVVVVIVRAALYLVHRRRKFAEELDDWESEYGPHRFRYQDLYVATKGFRDKCLLGVGGFGQVYRGIHPTSKIEIAVKKISHGSQQGIREFVSEIVSLGRLRHRNIVQLLGYCRRKGELLLVYDYMPNGSLDKYLHSQNHENYTPMKTLNWGQRYKIIKGVASGLLYLHEEWEQVVIHRDIKASNVLLDADLNGRLGDFGLARLYDHGSDPQTTHVVGTMGYLAPEQARNGKATRSTDVFGFGVFLLEVACGRRPIDPKAKNEEIVLLEWVFEKWKSGELLSVVDRRLEGEFDEEEAAVVLKVGMMCSSLEPALRPTMREVVDYLEGAVKLPGVDLPTPSRKLSFGGRWRVGGLVVGSGDGGGVNMSKSFSQSSSSIVESMLSTGR